jgi:hypothetical protein
MKKDIQLSNNIKEFKKFLVSKKKWSTFVRYFKADKKLENSARWHSNTPITLNEWFKVFPISCWISSAFAWSKTLNSVEWNKLSNDWNYYIYINDLK